MKKTAVLLLGSYLLLESVPVQSYVAYVSDQSLAPLSVTDYAFASRHQPYALRHEQARELLGVTRASQIGESRNAVELAVYVNRRVNELLPGRFKTTSRSVSHAITTQAERYGMDPLFVMALITRESRFNPHAIGTFGEIGLMQVKPSTALWLLEQGDMVGYTGAHDYEKVREALRDPVLNVKFGTAYLARLRTAFKGRGSLYVAAYNMGAPALKSSLRNGVHPTAYSNRVIEEYASLGRDFASSKFALAKFEHRHFDRREVASVASTFVRH